jgi:hypothetical protein
MSELHQDPAYQSEIDAMKVSETFINEAPTVVIESIPETVPSYTDSEKSLSREEVTLGLRKIAAMLALGGGIAALGTAGWLTHEAHQAQTQAEATISVQQSDNEVVPQYDGSHAKAHELINARNILVPLGASALGFALMQGNIAVRKERTES